MSNMSVAITASDGFVGPWISEMLGEDAIVIPDEALKEPLSLDAMLTPCKSLIHINSAALTVCPDVMIEIRCSR